ncbi:NUDIX hydrolase [Alicyclobacillus cycloheptanicus]|uniref:ADP-ribose pyrophosphatase YjhB (NUDIX family) n=1 Tax=Alicyclobacillus cycloheptanicus TaxID=1457 RepID=A0ABT9XI92_9BACL|nr:NUDIX hydrolase [Alicyclobacillus cycloheptanicus]MDQ0190003.1 ADP-ribose pyrophosphatase YjhB (NUDIX family) [Alicyclobacillus cycloheptanicus]WDM00090.1 NUDIX hydrolase [Alicyclobacillus cycloheptanicus]
MSRYFNQLIPSSIGTVVDEAGRCLMIQRTKEPYIGKWAMPGGKIELGEHPEAAIVREFEEETGLVTCVDRFAGVVSEVVPVQGGLSHFLMYVFRLNIVGGELRESEEGPLRWMAQGEIRDEGIPSDAFITSQLIFCDTPDAPRLLSLTSTNEGYQVDGLYR